MNRTQLDFRGVTGISQIRKKQKKITPPSKSHRGIRWAKANKHKILRKETVVLELKDKKLKDIVL